MEEAFTKHANKVAYSFMGKELTFAQVDAQSKVFAAYLQSLGLQRGDRVALMMPNMPQYPVAVAGVLRAGFVVVNVNPLYTARELEHQLKDSGAKAIVIIENFAKTLQDGMHGSAVSTSCCAPWATSWASQGRHRQLRGALRQEDGAGLQPARCRALQRRAGQGAQRQLSAPVIKPTTWLLQYTGGTTGVSKGAVLLHRNIIANVLQSEAWNEPAMSKVPAGEQPTSICALPLYHIFAFTVNMMLACAPAAKPC
jgi:long-chain acyl-CoA synthetase